MQSDKTSAHPSGRKNNRGRKSILPKPGTHGQPEKKDVGQDYWRAQEEESRAPTPAQPAQPAPPRTTAIGPDPTTLALQPFAPGDFSNSSLPQEDCIEDEYMPDVDDTCGGPTQLEGGMQTAHAGGNVDENVDYDEFEGLIVYDFMKPEYWTKEATEARLNAMYESKEGMYTEETELEKMNLPAPYNQRSRPTISEERVTELVQIVWDAIRNNAMARLDPAVMMEVAQEAEILRTRLASYLFTDRYSSFGRHFTKTDLLQHTADRLEVFTCIRGDLLIDFSCGANEFLPQFKETCLKKGKVVDGRAYDIISPAILEDFVQTSWFDVKPEDIGVPGERLIIGLNPPYGMNNALAKKFQDHALKFKPRIIVLIVPPSVPIPTGYKLLLEDRHTMADKSFYIPGLAEGNREQWNRTAPSLRMMAREDLYPLRDYLVMPGLPPPSRGYVFKPERFVSATHSEGSSAAETGGMPMEVPGPWDDLADTSKPGGV